MSIFKRGKHAKAEEPGSRYGNGTHPASSYGSLSPESVEEIAEAVEPYLVVQDEPELQDFPLEGLSETGKGWAEYRGYTFTEDGEEPVNPFELELDRVLGEIKELLLEKNASYGDSALNPVRIMSDADAAEQIRIRMDDKLSRLYRGFAFEDTETGNPEDTLKDLVGYYFLLKIAEARNA